MFHKSKLSSFCRTNRYIEDELIRIFESNGRIGSISAGRVNREIFCIFRGIRRELVDGEAKSKSLLDKTDERITEKDASLAICITWSCRPITLTDNYSIITISIIFMEQL